MFRKELVLELVLINVGLNDVSELKEIVFGSPRLQTATQTCCTTLITLVSCGHGLSTSKYSEYCEYSVKREKTLLKFEKVKGENVLK